MTGSRLRLRTGVAIGALIGLVTALLALVAAPIDAGAAPGDLDPTFSGDGVQNVSGTGTQPILYDVAVGADGTQTVVGTNNSGPTDAHLVLARLLGDGSFDPTFGGGDGLVESTPAQMTDGQSVALTPDGHIVVAGRVGSPAHIAVARFNADGTPDSTFDGDGFVNLDLATHAQEYAYGVAVDGSGRILLAAEANETASGTDFHFLTIRLLAGGGLDPAFAGGVVTQEGGTGPGDADGARAVAVDASGRVLSAGMLGNTGVTSGAVFRYTDSGAPDTTFGTGGKVSVPSVIGLQALVVDGDSPIVGGTASVGIADPDASFVVSRFTPGGTADGSATVKGPDGGWNLADLDRRADGFLVAVGTEIGPNLVTGREIRGAVAQLTPALALDPTFSGDGLATLDLGESDELTGVAYDVDGRPVAVGETSGATNAGTVVRYQDHTRMATVGAGGSLSTGSEASPGNPVTTTVTTPVAGTITITERRVPPSTSDGFSFLGVAVDITAPTATAADPLRIVFRLDSGLVDGATTAPLADDIAGLAPFRNGTRVPDCSAGAGTAADPDPCVASKTLEGDDVVLSVRTSAASTWTFGVGPVGAPRYWMAASDGGVFTFGQAAFFGSTGDIKLNSPMVGMAVAPDGRGYWMVAADGGVFAFGSSQFYGSMGGTKLNSPVVAMASAPDGKGYWLVAADGGVFSFGSAQFFGSMGGTRLNQPIVGMDAAPDGNGYWMVAKDGGIFSFGTSSFFGSMGGTKLNQPIVGMTSAPDGQGYWMVASDGGVFTFGSSTFLGSTGDIKLNKPIVSMAVAPDGKGYWMFASDGGVFSFGSAPFLGSLGDIRLNQPVVAGAA